MTTHAPSTRITGDSQTATWPVLAAAGAGLSALLTALGTFVDFNNNDHGGHDGIGAYLGVVGVIAVAAALVFGLVVRTATVHNAGRRGLVLAVLALITDVVFWSGLPCVLAAGAIACALTGRDAAGRFTNAGKAMLGLTTISIAAAIMFAIVG